jgi:hypothetical protein
MVLARNEEAALKTGIKNHNINDTWEQRPADGRLAAWPED